MHAACSVVGAVHMGDVQGTVAHAVYRLRSVPATVRVWRLANHHQHVDWSYFLCAFRRPIHNTDTDVWYFQAYVHRKGTTLFSVLGPTLHPLYFPLSSTLSSLNLNHHRYADGTQLFFFFYPSNFGSSITHLQNALEHISSWMTANPLTLSSKTEIKSNQKCSSLT